MVVNITFCQYKCLIVMYMPIKTNLIDKLYFIDMTVKVLIGFILSCLYNTTFMDIPMKI